MLIFAVWREPDHSHSSSCVLLKWRQTKRGSSFPSICCYDKRHWYYWGYHTCCHITSSSSRRTETATYSQSVQPAAIWSACFRYYASIHVSVYRFQFEFLDCTCSQNWCWRLFRDPNCNVTARLDFDIDIVIVSRENNSMYHPGSMMHPGMMAYSPEQMAWMQQMYAQQMLQYMQ